ncbi:ribonuclease H-like domain-containing protein [Tanacetum coccineum]
MKAVKEKEQLQKNTRIHGPGFFHRNLWRLINSGMSSNSKVGLGFEIQSNNEVLSYEEEMIISCVHCSKRIKIPPHGTSSEHLLDPDLRFQSVPQKQPIKDQATPKVNRKNWNAMMERELGEGYSFTKKKCFVCGSLSHLIKDYDYYEKKMAKEAEVNHANKLVPRSIQFNAGRTNINSVRPNINTGRTNVNPVRPRVNTDSSNINTVRSRQPVPTKTSNSFSPKRPQGNWGSAVKTSAGYNWRNSNPNSNCDSRYLLLELGMPKGNKDQLEDFEEFNGGSVTFGGSKGYISGKGKIRVGNLDFDSVSFVKELGHFNLFSISQICDKQHRFSWVFFLASKDETSGILQNFIRQIENQLSHRVKIIRSDNGTEFKNRDMLEFCGNKGIKQEYSNARTPQQNGVAERMNRTLIEAARTMLADSLLPTTFWAEAVSTACYIFNRDVELIEVPSNTVRNMKKKLKSRIILPQIQERRDLEKNFKQEKKASSTNTSEDNSKIIAFRRELKEIALKHLGKVSKNTSFNTPLVNTGSEPVNTGSFNPDDSPMPELKIFHKSETGIFYEASYDEEGVITDFTGPTNIN